MKNEFIHYEQALSLKELGFDEKCFAYYVQEPYCNSKKELKYRKPTYYEISGWKNSDKLISAKENNYIYVTLPLCQQAFRWFREKYNLDSFVKHLYKNNKKVGYYFGIDEYKSIEFQSESFKTYAEAELACLNKLIEIAKSI